MTDRTLYTSSSWLHGTLRKDLIKFILYLDGVCNDYAGDPNKKLGEPSAEVLRRLDVLEQVFGVEKPQNEEPDSVPFQIEDLRKIENAVQEEIEEDDSFPVVRLCDPDRALERAQIVADIRAKCDDMMSHSRGQMLANLDLALRAAVEAGAWNRVAEFVEAGRTKR